jgi:hypothetical protein
VIDRTVRSLHVETTWFVVRWLAGQVDLATPWRSERPVTLHDCDATGGVRLISVVSAERD